MKILNAFLYSQLILAILILSVNASRMAIAGGVSVNGEPAPRGTVISTRINGNEIGRYLIEQEGNYLIYIDNAEKYAGEKVSLYFAGLKAKEEPVIIPGKLLLMDINIDISESLRLRITSTTTIPESEGGLTGRVIAFPGYLSTILGSIVLVILFLLSIYALYERQWI